MPALPAVPGALKCLLKWQTGPGPIAENVLHIGYSGSASNAADVTQLATHVNALVVTNLVPYLFNQYQYVGATITDLSSNTGIQIAAPSNTTGALGGEALPAQCAVLVNYSISKHYRGGKPRTYLPLGQAGLLANDDTWTGAFAGEISVAMNAIMTGLNPYTAGALITNGLIAVSYYKGYADPVTHPSGRVTQGAALNPAGPSKLPLLVANCNPKPGTQRRRLGR